MGTHISFGNIKTEHHCNSIYKKSFLKYAYRLNAQFHIREFLSPGREIDGWIKSNPLQQRKKLCSPRTMQQRETQICVTHFSIS